MPIEEQAEKARAFVAGLVESLGVQATTTVNVVDDEAIEIGVDGTGLGFLIGPRGATLAALQELTRTAVQRRSSEYGARIVVDVAGYRAKRAAALREFTRTIAEEVLASGVSHSLEPMSAADRKIVHDAVNEMAGVQTVSVGQDADRHVVISTIAAPRRDEPVSVDDQVDGAGSGSDDSGSDDDWEGAAVE